jgi:hypothetical protein
MEATSKYCEFFTDDGQCGLGYHNGNPHPGNCRACISAGENNRAHAERLPSATTQLRTAAAAASRFARSGFALADAETLASRQSVCQSCEQWDAAGLRGTGRCRKCGCSTQAKLRMASEKCPLGKW